jgi:hypothetical protein
MRKDRQRAAALNNAEWCAAVWRSHGLPVERANGMWFCPRLTPRFYPNVVTIDAESPARQAALIVELARDASLDFSVKDSFACLDLAVAGLQTLFEARWLWRRQAVRPAAASALDWRRIDSEPRLAAWERAWRGVGADPLRIFRAELLDDAHVRVLAGFDATETIRAGGIAYCAAGTTGVTNIFGSRRPFLDALVALSAPAEIVCYERGPDLAPAVDAGFAMLGSLRVWARPAQAPHGTATVPVAL